MDIEHFLKERIKFARFFYKNSSKPFSKIMQDIENEKEPYIPPYSEDGEPPFLAEWLEARDGLNSAGLATLSMLSSAIQLYLGCWVDRINVKGQEIKKNGNKGWLNDYKKITKEFGVYYTACPANFELIEQIVLARNRTQHANQITSQGVSHLKKDLSKYPSPHFVSDEDKNTFLKGKSWWTMPEVHVTELKLDEAIIEIEKYTGWLECEHNRILGGKYA